MKYIRIHNKKNGMEYPWMADVRSVADLMEIEEKFHSRNAWCIFDYLCSKDYSQTVRDVFGVHLDPNGRNHSNPNNKLAPFLFASTLTFPEKKKFHPMLYFAEKLDGVVQAKLKILNETGRILINTNGGCMPWTSSFEELESMISERFPQYTLSDVKVSKWPEGKHFYATVDGTSIEVNGNKKWNSEHDAMTAAKKWLKDKKLSS